MRYAILTLFTASLASCGSVTSVVEYPSPDGKSRAVVKSTDKGACCSTSFEVELSLENDERRIFSGNGSGKLEVSWEGNNRLLLKAGDMYHYEITTRVLRDVPIQEDGSENAVMIKYSDT
jgi:hypothetical protein